MGKSIFICYIAASKRGRRVAFSAGILFLLRFTWCYVYCSVIDDISFLAASCVFSLSRVFSRCLAYFLAVSCVFSLSREFSRCLVCFLAVLCAFSLSRVFSRCLVCLLAVSCVYSLSRVFSRCLVLSSHSSMCFVSSLFRFEFSRRFSLNPQWRHSWKQHFYSLYCGQSSEVWSFVSQVLVWSHLYFKEL